MNVDLYIEIIDMLDIKDIVHNVSMSNNFFRYICTNHIYRTQIFDALDLNLTNAWPKIRFKIYNRFKVDISKSNIYHVMMDFEPSNTEPIVVSPQTRILDLCGINSFKLMLDDSIKNLTELDIHESNITDWSFMFKMNNLITLELQSIDMTDSNCPDLQHNTKLRNLKINGTKLSTLSVLNIPTSLERLTEQYNIDLKDTSIVSRLINLKYLDCQLDDSIQLCDLNLHTLKVGDYRRIKDLNKFFRSIGRVHNLNIEFFDASAHSKYLRHISNVHTLRLQIGINKIPNRLFEFLKDSNIHTLSVIYGSYGSEILNLNVRKLVIRSATIDIDECIDQAKQYPILNLRSCKMNSNTYNKLKLITHLLPKLI